MDGESERGMACLITMLILSCLLFLPGTVSATPEHSERTGQGCKACHLAVEGGALNETGLAYAASGYTWPPEGGYRVLGPVKKRIRILLGFFHIVSAFMWFGTILYVHILLRPAYASKGLPRGEMMMGLITMAVVGVSGVFLTASRIRGLEVLYTTPWGMLLSAKAAFYVVMVATAVFTVAVVGPRLRKGVKRAGEPAGGAFDPQTLSSFDGAEGRPSYIAFKGKVYDVGGLKLWKGGKHMKHLAGEDLTAAISKAPHGPEKLDAVRTVGTLDASLKPPLNPYQKIFYVIAYVNLVMVFAVLFVITVWRWGIY